MWFVYMAITSKGNIYTGITKDVKRRCYEHNYTSKGDKLLKDQIPIVIVWNKKMKSKSEALILRDNLDQMFKIEKVKIILENPRVSYEELNEMLFFIKRKEY